jgi:SAM-dependent methyltransferase
MQRRRELDYEDRLLRERETFAGQEHIHEDLPPSAHHWSNRHVLPKLNALGVPSTGELITGQIRERAQRLRRDTVVLSLGSGNGDQELGWLRTLAEAGVHNVRMRLLELNPVMQERAAAAAQRMGLADRVELVEADFNTWRADTEHDVVVGFQALHHVLDLEHLYGQIRDSLDPDGVLLVHDMIGRNGHRRWPEALELVERVWSTLPPRLRRNAVTGEIDEHYADLDCAVDGFEGIRAQDVLPVLLDHLHPSLFFAYGNVIDPFVDRVYGGNFDMADEHDRAVVEHLGELDDSSIDLGIVTPTRLTALFHPRPQPLRAYGRRTPQRCVRDTTAVDPAGRISFQPPACDPGRLLRGAGLVVGRMNGVAHDNWAARTVEFPVLTTAEVHGIELALYVPDWMPRPGSVTVHLDDAPVATFGMRHGLVEQTVPVRLAPGRTVRLALAADWAVTPSANGLGSDRRPLSYVVVGMYLREG